MIEWAAQSKESRHDQTSDLQSLGIYSRSDLCRATGRAHTAITLVLVVPDEKRVIALEPEFIWLQDGQVKQDCERNAAHRWLTHHATYLLTTHSVPAIVAAGRARWKIENENNNVLKNYGYHCLMLRQTSRDCS